MIGRLLDVSKSNPKFTSEDVLAETATILSGVFTKNPICRVFLLLKFRWFTGDRYIFNCICIRGADVSYTSRISRESLSRSLRGDAGQKYWSYAGRPWKIDIHWIMRARDITPFSDRSTNWPRCGKTDKIKQQRWDSSGHSNIFRATPSSFARKVLWTYGAYIQSASLFKWKYQKSSSFGLCGF